MAIGWAILAILIVAYFILIVDNCIHYHINEAEKRWQNEFTHLRNEILERIERINSKTGKE